jgi:hypothetical protein
MGTGNFHIFIGWIAMIFGVLSGGIIGLFFHKDQWAGGYNSFRRRLIRLGHISFIGLGFMNIMFGLTLLNINFPELHTNIASSGFLAGLITMPSCCFLSAWKKPFRHLFPIPVISILTGIILLLLGWPIS